MKKNRRQNNSVELGAVIGRIQRNPNQERAIKEAQEVLAERPDLQRDAIRALLKIASAVKAAAA